MKEILNDQEFKISLSKEEYFELIEKLYVKRDHLGIEING